MILDADVNNKRAFKFPLLFFPLSSRVLGFCIIYYVCERSTYIVGIGR